MMGGRYYNRYEPICMLGHHFQSSGYHVFSFFLRFNRAASVDSVDDIIDHYKKEQIVEGYNLKEPVSVQVTASRPVLLSLTHPVTTQLVFVPVVAAGASFC